MIMCLESPDVFMENHEIQLYTRKFLEDNLKKSNSIIEQALKKILENEDEVYSISLNGLKLKKFKLSIEEHFQWIQDKCIDSTILFKDYNSNFEPSLQKAYCHIYQIIKVSIKDIKPKVIRENLEDYFCAFIKKYCSKKEYLEHSENCL